MPHDANGEVINEGDIVFLRCKVTEVYPGQDMCNLVMEATEGGEVEGYETYRPTVTCNADSVRKLVGPKHIARGVQASSR